MSTPVQASCPKTQTIAACWSRWIQPGMATINKVQGWLCLLMTEDSSFHGASAIKCWRPTPNPVWSKYPDAQRVSSLHVYHHHERNHPGEENPQLFPASNQLPQSERKVRSRERLGRLLCFCHREGA